MTVQEMHIEIDLLLQKVNSNVIAYIKPEEKDVFLNGEVLRYINQKMNPQNPLSKGRGFQDNKKVSEDLKGLIEHTITPLPVYYRDDRSVFTYLPSNCLRVIGSRSNTKDLCGAVYNPVTTNDNIYYTTFILPTVSTASNYSGFTIEINSVEVFNIGNYPQFHSGFTGTITSDKARFQLIDFILEEIRKAGYDCAYENYLGIFSLSSIIVKGTVPLTIILKKSTFPPPVTTVLSTSTPLSKSVIKITPVSSTERKNTLTKTEDIYDLLDTSFGTTRHNAPLVTIERGMLNVFHNKKFIVSSVNLDFIRIPKKISLPLNQSCDLDPSVHAEIVGNLVDRLAGITTATNYQLLLNENNKKE